jgi:Mn2+/Fe2+ NRAMP family transporter
VCTASDGGEGYCQEIGLTYAGDALEGTLGQSAKYVWAVGLLAAGQSSTMTVSWIAFIDGAIQLVLNGGWSTV